MSEQSALNFGVGPDKRAQTISYTQALTVVKALAAIGIYGDLYENEESNSKPAGYVLIEDMPKDAEVEKLYVLFYGGDYHNLALVAQQLARPEKTLAVKRIYEEFAPWGSIYNIPSVAKAIETELANLIG